MGRDSPRSVRVGQRPLRSGREGGRGGVVGEGGGGGGGGKTVVHDGGRHAANGEPVKGAPEYAEQHDAEQEDGDRVQRERGRAEPAVYPAARVPGLEQRN